jgi:peptidylprolyl isomerase
VKNRTVPRVRAVTGIAAVALAGSLALAGCSSDDNSSKPSSSSASTSSASPSSAAAATASAADVAALAKVTVKGDVGKKPTISVAKGFTVTAPVARLETPGTGAAVKDGQLLGFNLAVVQGSDGSALADTYSASPQYYMNNASSGLPTALLDALKGQKIGARILFANPSQDSEGKAVTYVYTFEVASAQNVPARASGTPVAPKAGLPTVKLESNGEPKITIPKGYKAPKDLVAQTLIKGKGEKVKATSAVAVQYSGWLLNGTSFDSSWSRGEPIAASLAGGVIEGWTKGLTGQTVGSQVLLVIPASLAYGSQAQGSIPANSPLIFVVDILAVGN